MRKNFRNRDRKKDRDQRFNKNKFLFKKRQGEYQKML